MLRLFLALVVFGACAPQFENELQSDFLTDSLAASPARSYGIWVYGPREWIHDKTQVDAFISFLLRNGINNVYLSTNFELLENPALPAFLLRMSNNGFSTEALIGKTIWGSAAGRPDMLAQIDRIHNYNRSRPYIERFKAIHLDVEPWIGSGSSTSWLTPLINSYTLAKSHLEGKGLTLSVDFSGSKGANLSLSQRQAIANATDKIVLMLYEANQTDVLSRAERFMNGLSATSKVVVGIRSVDFSDPFTTIDSLHSSLQAVANYRGWAIYHYDSVHP